MNLAVENNQILLLAGGQFVNPQVNSASRLYEFHLDGTRNASFGSSGEISPPANNVNFAGMTVQPDGDIILSYHVSLSEFVSRYSPSGSPDLTFGTAGQVTLENFLTQYGNNIALQPDGKILITGDTDLSPDPNAELYQPEIVRINSDGSLDTSFGTNGMASIVLPHYNDNTQLSSVTVQPLGRILTETKGSELFGSIGDPVVSFGGATSISTSSGTPTAVYDVSETAGSATITLGARRRPEPAALGPVLDRRLGRPRGRELHARQYHRYLRGGIGNGHGRHPDPQRSQSVAAHRHAARLGTPTGGAVLGSVSAGDLHIIPVEGIVITPSQLPSVMQGGQGRRSRSCSSRYRRPTSPCPCRSRPRTPRPCSRPARWSSRPPTP